MLATFEELSRRVAFGLPPIAAASRSRCSSDGSPHSCSTCCRPRTSAPSASGTPSTSAAACLWKRNMSCAPATSASSTSGRAFDPPARALFGLPQCDRLQQGQIGHLGRHPLFQPQKDPRTTLPPAARVHRFRTHPQTQLRGIFKFLIDPFWPCVLIPAGTVVACWLLPKWTGLIGFAGFMLSLPALWFLGVRILDFLSSGVSRDGDCYTLRYSNRYYLHTVVFPFDKIALVNVRQSILQRGDRKCDLKVSTRAEGGSATISAISTGTGCSSSSTPGTKSHFRHTPRS